MSEAPAAPKNKLGEYELFEKVSTSSSGNVYRAKNVLMGQTVLVKTMPAAAKDHPDVMKRFEREIKLAAKLSHPNLVTAYHAGCDAGIHYMVMENIQGQDLATLVKQEGPLPVDVAIDYISQAARGLAYLHEQGVCHRNIKPANLLLDEHGQIHVTNMTSALIEEGSEVADDEQDQLTRQGQLLGTLEYMSPEQAIDAHTADHKSDQYSLGCTFYYLLTGQPPYPVKGQMKLVAAHSQDPVPSLREAREDVSEPIDEVYQTMLAKSAKLRHSSMKEMLKALQQALYGGATTFTRRKSTFSWEIIALFGLAVLVVILAGALIAGVLVD